MLSDYETFIKIYPACHMCYRYQEYTDWVHNFNDKFLLKLAICIFMRENVKQHVAIGNASEILQEYLHAKLNQQTVVNAYMLFAPNTTMISTV